MCIKNNNVNKYPVKYLKEKKICCDSETKINISYIILSHV